MQSLRIGFAVSRSRLLGLLLRFYSVWEDDAGGRLLHVSQVPRREKKSFLNCLELISGVLTTRIRTGTLGLIRNICDQHLSFHFENLLKPEGKGPQLRFFQPNTIQ